MAEKPERTQAMKEGIYKVDYQGIEGMGMAMMILETGAVTGADVVGGIYDGVYTWNERTRLLDVDVEVAVPEGVVLVTGKVAPAGGLKFGVRCSFPRDPNNQTVQAETDFGPVLVRIQLLRTYSP